MVDIDKVYQRVLALANKEQRGYITPQEFNLYANQAQGEIYEQYHYDLNNFELRDASGSLNSDVTDLTRQKLDIFLLTAGVSAVSSFSTIGNAIQLPSYIYRVSRVEVNGFKAEYLDNNKFKDAVSAGRLVGPSYSRPVYMLRTNALRINNGANITSGVGLHYYRLPVPVSWGYFVVSGKALFDPQPSKTVNFELHTSDETELVYKILKLSGISMAKQDLLQAGQGMESMQVQQEKQ
tara:strand:+ start:56 stop:766 length:711 start_codon:yes stop_codon:yes gene_type:complete